MLFGSISYRDLVSNYYNDYSKMYGKYKFDKIVNKVNLSKAINKLLSDLKQNKSMPYNTLFIHTIMGIPYFMFAKPETIALASILALDRWNTECNSISNVANESRLKFIVSEIINELLKIKL